MERIEDTEDNHGEGERGIRALVYQMLKIA